MSRASAAPTGDLSLMSIRTIAIATAAAIVIGAAGYFVGTSLDATGAAETVAEQPAAKPEPAHAEATMVAQLSDTQRREVEGIVKDYLTNNPDFIRDYLMANPEVVRDAIDELQRKQNEEEQAAQVAAIGDNRDLLFSSPRQVVMGNPNGDVTLIEFFDYNCGYCKRALEDMMVLMKADPKLRVVLKEFPVLGPASVDAARVGVAVRMQDKTGKKYLEFHQKLLTGRGQVDRARALAAAREVGLDVARIERDMASEEARTSLEESMSLAEKLGLNGTPSYVIGQNVVVGAVGLEALRGKINESRCGKSVC